MSLLSSLLLLFVLCVSVSSHGLRASPRAPQPNTKLLTKIQNRTTPKRFKGVSGVHAVASVAPRSLAGRVFPSASRGKAKGERVSPGHGLLLEVDLAAVPRSPRT